MQFFAVARVLALLETLLALGALHAVLQVHMRRLKVRAAAMAIDSIMVPPFECLPKGRMDLDKGASIRDTCTLNDVQAAHCGASR